MGIAVIHLLFMKYIFAIFYPFPLSPNHTFKGGYLGV